MTLQERAKRMIENAYSGNDALQTENKALKKELSDIRLLLAKVLDITDGNQAMGNDKPADVKPADVKPADVKPAEEMPSVKIGNGKIELGQYDPIFALYVRHPINNRVILLNGLPSNVQKHYLSDALRPLFDGLKEAANKGKLRTIRNLSDEKSTGKTLTCGNVYSGNCKCNDKPADVKPADDLLSGLNSFESMGNERDAENMLVETASDDDIANVLASFDDKPADDVKPADKPLKGIALWSSTRNPKLGSMAEYVLAKKARGLMVQRKVKHTGFTVEPYKNVIALALDSGKITVSELR